ncbi:MAG: hypothetical protein R2788_06525 [Saprospiraceae bacterium]
MSTSPSGTSDPPMYWYYKSMKQDGSQYLLGTGYDPEFSPDQFLREEKVGNGMLLIDFIIYEKPIPQQKNHRHKQK